MQCRKSGGYHLFILDLHNGYIKDENLFQPYIRKQDVEYTTRYIFWLNHKKKIWSNHFWFWSQLCTHQILKINS